MIYGYARVSTADQNLDRQLNDFKQFGVDEIFEDKISGKDFERENYLRLVKKIKKGDLLVIKSIDRLGRNYDMIIEEWRKITKQIEADIVVLDMPILDTRQTDKNLIGRFISDIVLQILSFVAETERENIKARQMEGIKSAKARGVHMGRPKLDLPETFNEIAHKWKEREISAKEACEILQINKSAFYRYAKQKNIIKISKNSKERQKHNKRKITYVLHSC